ncbi:MAG TPA: hypothetical protein PLS53_10905, partial [Thermoanaerobaculaceae bacterium]|nr:hypothetical protein [Thermoanaerobaculaceae bacterium]
PADPTESQPAQFPSLPQQARNAAGAIFRAVRSLTQGQPTLSPEALLATRLAQCRACPASTPGTVDVEHRRCLDCGCYLFAKVKLMTEECPRAKW